MVTMHKAERCLRVALVVAAVLAAAASATAPGSHSVQRAKIIPVGYDETWSALVDLFADRNWSISNLDKESGIITADWHSLGDLGNVYADCGGSGISRAESAQVRFNVRVKPAAVATEVVVNASFRQWRSFDGSGRFVDCASRGTVESLVHDQIAMRTGTAKSKAPGAANPSNDPAFAAAYWCSEQDGACRADESACSGFCHRTNEVWCARYFVNGKPNFLCGMTERACQALREHPKHRDERLNDCVPQKASGRPFDSVPSAAAPRENPSLPLNHAH